MNAAAQALEAAHAVAADVANVKPMIGFAYTAATLAAGGVSDAFSYIFTGKSILAQVVPDLSPWAQFGIGGIFLLGFIASARILLNYHEARIAEWRERWQEERDEKSALIARIREMNDARDRELSDMRRNPSLPK